jgi:hypothetical protein
MLSGYRKILPSGSGRTLQTDEEAVSDGHAGDIRPGLHVDWPCFRAGCVGIRRGKQGERQSHHNEPHERHSRVALVAIGIWRGPAVNEAGGIGLIVHRGLHQIVPVCGCNTGH